MKNHNVVSREEIIYIIKHNSHYNASMYSLFSILKYNFTVNPEEITDFLKTSTGKIATGATIPAAVAMLLAISDSNTPCGIKFSGGIKTKEQASLYMRLAEHMRGVTTNKQWFRFGMSQLP